MFKHIYKHYTQEANLMSDKFFKNLWDDSNNNADKTIKKKKEKEEELDLFLKKSQEKIIQLIQKKNKNSNGGPGFNLDFDFSQFKKFMVLIPLFILLLWLSTGFYTIQPYEEGVVLRFGKYSRTSLPGLNYKLPSPFEMVEIKSVTRVNKEEIGFRSLGKNIISREELLKSTVSNESQMLTTDENIIDVNFEVQWKINDIKKHLFNVNDGNNESTIKFVAETAMREVIGLTKITDVLAKEKDKIGQDVKTLMQSILDSYDIGVSVIGVQLRRIEPPQEVIDAYRDVQNAKQDKEREINKAESYRNDIVPRSRGAAEQILQDAEAYKNSAIASASGDSQRFNTIYDQYKNAKDVTRKRMYLETMEKILPSMDKVIVDRNSSNVVPFLPLNEINKQKNSKD